MKGRCLPATIIEGQPITALAPMQDVTNLPFMTVVNEYGPPDYFVTEYLRVHDHSRLDPSIIDSVVKNPSDRPVFVQLIGENIPHMVRTVKELLKHPIAGVDFNMGCPALKVYKKKVGGGLLNDLPKVDELLGALRASTEGLFTVKARIGFSDTESFELLLDIINKHAIDLLSIHGRTVKEMYRSEVHYDFIKRAVERVNCPVLANGNIDCAEKAVEVLNYTGARGLMVGRSFIRNPWIFSQIRDFIDKGSYYQPTLKDVYGYIERLFAATAVDEGFEKYHVNYLKKYLNFIGQGVDPESLFLKAMRRVQSSDTLFDLCKERLLDNGNGEKLFANKPYAGVIARPNCEGPAKKT